MTATILPIDTIVRDHSAYWNQKILRNSECDAGQTAALQAADWWVIRFWGHEIDEAVGDCAALVEEAIPRRSNGGR